MRRQAAFERCRESRIDLLRDERRGHVRVHVGRSRECGEEEDDDRVTDTYEEGDGASVETAKTLNAAVNGIKQGSEKTGLVLLRAKEKSGESG